MTTSATVRVMTPEEIAARAGGETAFLRLPQRATLFAERAMRLRQLARGHAMAGFLDLMADLALAQQQQCDALAAGPGLPLPDAQALNRAARAGQPPLPATDWPRDPVWHGIARTLAQALRARAPAPAHAVLDRLIAADEVFLERQADALLHGLGSGLDLACAPVVGAALQVMWVHLVSAVDRHASSGPEAGTRLNPASPFGRIDDSTACPCCGSRPVASVTRSSGESLGQRYLHCSLCSTEWHLVRMQCSHCLSDKSLAYQSLDAANADATGEAGQEAASARAAQAAVQAETCDDCGHYLKIVHTDRDPMVDPLADDLASLTLDLLVSETGLTRHGVNFMLLFGDPQDDPDSGGTAPPDPGGA